jgi:hypothetical protein
LHERLQLLPEERGDEQLPRLPLDGAVTAHELPAAFTEIGMLSRAAASHQIILDFIASIDAKRASAKSSALVSTFAE